MVLPHYLGEVGLRKAVAFAALCSLALVFCMRGAYAATAKYATLWTTDASGIAKINFEVDDTVCIHWVADGTVDINVYYQDSINVLSQSNLPSSGSVTFIPKMAGSYVVRCTGADPLIIIASGTFFVIPELAFGTVTATVAGLGAFELEKLKRRKRHEI
jgi:hypothetical protein